MNIRYLLRRARTLYPMRDYLSESAVRHNRRKWIKAVCLLGKKWVGHPDRRVQRGSISVDGLCLAVAAAGAVTFLIFDILEILS